MSNVIDNKTILPKSFAQQDMTQSLAAKADAQPRLNGLQEDVAKISALSSSKSMTSAMGYSETLSISLTTQEGDQVTVDFKQLYAQYKSYKEAQSFSQGEDGSVRFFASTEEMEANQFEENFAFSVNGDLNEAELQAVFDVFEQVDKLANKFFDGNIESALAQAKSLNIDFNQLQSLSFKVSQTAVAMQQSQSSAYTEVQGESPNTAKLQEIPAYLQRWQAALARLEAVFQNAQESFDDMMSGALEQRFPEQDSREGWFERVSRFHDELLAYAQAQNDTSESVQDEPGLKNPEDVEQQNASPVLDSTAENNDASPEKASVDIKV